MNGAFLIDGVRVESRLNRIHRPDGAVQVEPKIMQVLLCLARQPGEVVTKDELIRTVWPATSATDDVLARAISELRKAFGDDPRAPRVIETIRKGGYRLLGQVESDPEPSRVAGNRPWLLGGAALVVLVAVVAFLVTKPALKGSLDSIPLTSLKGVEKDPSIAPNGRMVAFSWQGPGGDNWDIYVTLRDQATPQRLTHSPDDDGSPAWSPDGTRIAFRRRSDETCSLLVVPAIGGQERQLGDCGANNYPDLVWSPDGRWLAHNDGIGDGLHAIVLVDAQSGERRVASTPPAGIWGDFDPAFSPDGTEIAYARAYSEGIQDLVVRSVNGGPEERITFDHRNIYGLTWAPDGRSLIYASNRRGDYDLWRVARAGGEPTRFLGGPGSLVNPVIDVAGSALVYEHRRYDFDLRAYDLDADGREPVLASSSTRWELYPALSSDARRLAFSSNRSGSYEIWISDFDGASPRRLTDFGGPLVSTPAWSPDDELIAFDARPEGNAEIFVVDPAGGPPRALTSHAADDLAPSWTRDGQWILFASNRSGSWQVWRTSPDGAEPEQLTTQGGFRALDGPDGIYYTRFGEAGLWSLPDEQRQADFPDPVDWGNWFVNDRGLYQLDRSEGIPWVVLHPWAGEPRRLLQAGSPVPTGDAALTVGSDGRTLVLGHLQDRWVDLMWVADPPLD